MKKNDLSKMCLVGMIFLLTVVSNCWSEENENINQEPDRIESNDMQNDSEAFEEYQSPYTDDESNHETDAENEPEPVNNDEKIATDVNETEEEYPDSYTYDEYENESEEVHTNPDEKQVKSNSADTGDADTGDVDTWNAEFDNSEAKEY